MLYYTNPHTKNDAFKTVYGVWRTQQRNAFFAICDDF